MPFRSRSEVELCTTQPRRAPRYFGSTMRVYSFADLGAGEITDGISYNAPRAKMTTATGHRYIVNDPEILGGEPIIVGTRTPVRAIVETWRLGVPVEEISNLLPHLTLAQVFDALSYYSDHQEDIHAHIERNRVLPHQIDSRVSNR
jgi:uncharacterized protein (DUF433 family)